MPQEPGLRRRGRGRFRRGASKARRARYGAQALSGRPALGDTVWLIPGHCDPTVNLHNQLIAVRGGLQDGCVDAVEPVLARGVW